MNIQMAKNEHSSSPPSQNPFKKGAEVEVSFMEEGFRGSWYAATVLRPPPPPKKKNHSSAKILLEFHSLVANDAGEPLRESVDVILVRPVPPREARRRFRVGEDVDAFHSDGWWEGIVIAVLDGGGERYSVFFRSSREQIDFHESQLRVHREWVYGKWEPPMMEECELMQLGSAEEGAVAERD